MLLVVAARAQPTVRRQWLDAGQVPIELGGEEARSAHLAVGHDIDPGVGLVAQREVDGVIEDLGDVRGTQVPASGGIHREREPARTGVRPDDGRREWRGAVGPSSSLLGVAEGEHPCRVRHEQAMEVVLAEPVLAQGVAERAEQEREPGRPAERRPVTTARGIVAQDDVVEQPILGQPVEELERAVRGIAPAEGAVVLERRTRRAQLPVVAAVDDLVDVAQRDVRGIRAAAPGG